MVSFCYEPNTSLLNSSILTLIDCRFSIHGKKKSCIQSFSKLILLAMGYEYIYIYEPIKSAHSLTTPAIPMQN